MLTTDEMVKLLSGDDEVSRVLAGASILVERGWTQGAMARTIVGLPASPGRIDAVCWCASGAIWAAARKLCGERRGPTIEGLARERLRDVIRPVAVTIWNDAEGRTADEVAEKLREAAVNANAGGNA